MNKSIKSEIKQLIKNLKLSCNINSFQNIVDWTFISYNQKLSEDFIREFQDKLDWHNISVHQTLSENFIRKFKDKVDWDYISWKQKLSEDFIREFQDKINWNYISEYQKLSEDFIREFQDKVKWGYISWKQKLSEDFIREFQDKVNWDYILKYQKLSEDFICEFQDKVNWENISRYQKLSESFIEEFQDKMDWDVVKKYQKLAKSFRKKYNLKLPKNNWLYKSVHDKMKYIRNHTDYKIHRDSGGYYIELYKSVLKNYYSTYNFQFKYEVGHTYETQCDCIVNIENSFGFSCWSKVDALGYYNSGRLLKVKTYIKDIGAIVYNHRNKVRSFKITVLEEIF